MAVGGKWSITSLIIVFTLLSGIYENTENMKVFKHTLVGLSYTQMRVISWQFFIDWYYYI